MKKIECIIRPSSFVFLKNQLAEMGIHGMTVLEAGGFGRQRGYTGTNTGNDFEVDLIPKFFLIIVTSDGMVEDVIDKICKICYTGEVGDGKIFVVPIEEAVRIRTRERGEKAI